MAISLYGNPTFDMGKTYDRLDLDFMKSAFRIWGFLINRLIGFEIYHLLIVEWDPIILERCIRQSDHFSIQFLLMCQVLGKIHYFMANPKKWGIICLNKDTPKNPHLYVCGWLQFFLQGYEICSWNINQGLHHYCSISSQLVNKKSRVQFSKVVSNVDKKGTVSDSTNPIYRLNRYISSLHEHWPEKMNL